MILNPFQKKITAEDFYQTHGFDLPESYLDTVNPMEVSLGELKGQDSDGASDMFCWYIPVFNPENQLAISELVPDSRFIDYCCFKEYEEYLKFDGQMKIPDWKSIIPFTSIDGPTLCFDYRIHKNNPPIVMMKHMLVGSDNTEGMICPMQWMARDFGEFVDRMNPEKEKIYIESDLRIEKEEFIYFMGEYYYTNTEEKILYRKKRAGLI